MCEKMDCDGGGKQKQTPNCFLLKKKTKKRKARFTTGKKAFIACEFDCA